MNCKTYSNYNVFTQWMGKRDTWMGSTKHPPKFVQKEIMSRKEE